MEQVIITTRWLERGFQVLADRETLRGIPTVIRTVSWIEERYGGSDRPARIRAFLRDAHDQWGTRWAVLGGDVDVVPTRYVPWEDVEIPTDLYYECLDGEWNEDGDAIFGEPPAGTTSTGRVNDVAVAPGGAVWVATNAGVARLESGRFTVFDSRDGLPSEDVQSVGIGPDGSVWVAGTGGVARWDGGSGWTAFTAQDGVPGAVATCVVPVSATEVWVGTDQGLARFDGRGWTSWGQEDGMPANLVTALAADAGSVWIGTVRGAARFSGGQFTIFDTSTSGILSNWVLAIAAGDAGRVWFGHADNFFAQGGLSVFDGNSWVGDPLPAFGGLDVRDMAFGPAPGEIWAATSRGLFHRGATGDELLDGNDGLAGPETFAVVVAPDSSLVLGGPDGLTVGTPGTWTVYTKDDGLPVPPLDYDTIDLTPDLVVGRIPAADAAQLAVYLRKLFEYERGEACDRVETALFLGEVLFEGPDGKNLCQAAAATFPPSFARNELYEVDGNQDAARVIAELDRGPGIVVHVGHGSYDVLGVGPGLQLLFNADLDGIDSGGRYGFVVGYNCNSGGYDQDSSMEHLLFNPRGGAIATMSNSRESIAAIDSEINQIFFRNLFASPHANPAVALQETRRDLLGADPDRFRVRNWWRRLYLSRSYLGAPTIALWRETPRSLRVDYPTRIPNARAPFAVTVADWTTGLPVEGARVCVSRGSEDYAYGFTDAAGAVSFDFRPESPGLVSVVVTAPDHRPHEGRVIVTEATAPNLVAAGWERMGGRPWDSRDPWYIALALRNTGRSSTTGWTLTLRSEDPRVTVVGSEGTLLPLDAGATGRTSLFVLDVDPSLRDGDSFRLVLEGRGASTFAESYRVTVQDSDLVLDGISWAGSGLFPRITNRGSAATGSLTATLTALDDRGTVVDSVASVRSVEPGESIVFLDGFDVAGEAGAPFELRITDPRGRTLTRVIDREPPDGATGARAEPRDGGALLTWTPSSSADLAGYRIYGRDRGEPWREALDRLVTQASRATVDVPPGGSREFLVLAVDSTGNESADSSLVTAYSTPPDVPGWPRRLTSIIGPSPLVASDLDGDGAMEILLGSMWEANAVHVFHADGSEWTDGDADPATHGIFGKTGERVHAAPLAVDVDGDGLREIFAASLDGFLHAWRIDGPADAPPTPVTGWPVHVSAGGLRSSPVAGDLDGDGELEIAVVATAKTVHAFETDGTPMPGWPRTTGMGGLGSTPAVFDLDGDGLDDVVFGATDGFVYALSGDGTDLPGWPVAVGSKVTSSPALADVDGDGDLEIFVIAESGKVWGFEHEDRDGQGGADVLPGWPVVMNRISDSPPSPAIADLDGDLVPEIVVNGDEEIAIFHADGSHFPGWPLRTGVAGENSAVIADLDGDGSFDILASSADYRLTAYRLDGTVLPGWPRRFRETPNATPFVADVDGDGDLDVVLGSDDRILRVTDVKGRALPGAAPWPGYHGGARMQGVYVQVPYNPPSPPSAAGTESLVALSRLALLPAAPNPFHGATEIRFILPEGTRVRVEIFDVRGRRVAAPADGALLPAGPHAVTWDGRDAAGRVVASGVYFVRVDAGAESRSGKILHLR